MPDLTPAAASVHSEEAERRGARLQASPLTGTVFVLIQFDVCEEIKLTRLSEIISARAHLSAQHEASRAGLHSLSTSSHHGADRAACAGEWRAAAR